jgi:hypothetical protein
MYQWWTGTTYVIDWDTNVATGEYNMYYLTWLSSLDDARIYHHTWSIWFSGWLSITGFWYNHNSISGTETPYSRYIVFKPVDDYSSNTGNILQVEVHVLADRWIGNYEIVLESLLWDIR